MKIFISYRREDSAGYAGRLFDYLAAHFGSHNIFMDVDTIQPGEDFRRAVQNAVGTCEIVLVMMGKQWLNIADEQGRRRLEDPRDWVRVETASALANPQVRVIPVLVRGAGMPAPEELPDELRELAWRNAVELSDNRFSYDANQLIRVIDRMAPVGKTRTANVRVWAGILGLTIIGLVLLFRFGMLPLSLFMAVTPTSSPTSTQVQTNTEVSVPFTPTDEIVGTLKGLLPVGVRKVELSDLTASMPSIWDENDIFLQDMRSPGRLSYSGAVRAAQEYRFFIYWCATNAQTLNDNLESMRISFYVNDESVPDEYVLEYDHNPEGWTCRYQVVALSGWSPGQSYMLEAERNILTNISDGKTSYPAGIYVRELTVTVE